VPLQIEAFHVHANSKIFKRGDWVYLHNPIARRGKAEKFAYQYQGPYEILQVVSPLIYKMKVGEGKVVIHVVHINRLKETRGKMAGHDEGRTQAEKLKAKQSTESRPPGMITQDNDNGVTQETFAEVPPHVATSGVGTEELSLDEYDPQDFNDSSPAREEDRHSEWLPDTRYMRQRLRSRARIQQPCPTHPIIYVRGH
jgi:hypothetical protein